MVLRRSTTLWTCPSAFKKAPRSTLIFMVCRVPGFLRSNDPKISIWGPKSLAVGCHDSAAASIAIIAETSDSYGRRKWGLSSWPALVPATPGQPPRESVHGSLG